MSSLSGLPPVDAAMKEREKFSLEGSQVNASLRFRWKDNPETIHKTIEMKLQQGTEVMLVKKRVHQLLGYNHRTMVFKHNNKVMLDPLSLVDAWGQQPDHCNIDVYVDPTD